MQRHRQDLVQTRATCGNGNTGADATTLATHELRSEIPGNVWKIEVAAGDRVSDGDVVVILESMKMEVPLAAPCSGTVTTLAIEPEQFVAEGDLIAVFESPDQ